MEEVGTGLVEAEGARPVTRRGEVQLLQVRQQRVLAQSRRLRELKPSAAKRTPDDVQSPDERGV